MTLVPDVLTKDTYDMHVILSSLDLQYLYRTMNLSKLSLYLLK